MTKKLLIAFLTMSCIHFAPNYAQAQEADGDAAIGVATGAIAGVFFGQGNGHVEGLLIGAAFGGIVGWLIGHGIDRERINDCAQDWEAAANEFQSGGFQLRVDWRCQAHRNLGGHFKPSRDAGLAIDSSGNELFCVRYFDYANFYNDEPFQQTACRQVGDEGERPVWHVINAFGAVNFER